MMELTAHLDYWALVRLGVPEDIYVLLGQVSGHDRLRSGNFITTSAIRFLSPDLTFAYTASQGRRYTLGPRTTTSVSALCTLVSVFGQWGLAGHVPVICNVDPAEIAGRHLLVPDA